MIAVDALLFDLDGTLIDSKRDLARSVQYLQRHYGAFLSTDEEVAAFIGDGVSKLVQRALPDLPKSELDTAVVAFKKFYREHCLDHTRPYAGVRKTLKHFRRKKMAVVTNKPVGIAGFMLTELKLNSYFEIVIGGDSLKNKKPHPEPIVKAYESMRVLDPKRVLVVGDGSNDVLAGRAAGTRTCGIKSNIGDPKKLANSRPDFLIKRLPELIRICA